MNEQGKNELTPAEPVIEGEFVELSGLSCRRCLSPLPVGGRVCPVCARAFYYPTPRLADVPDYYRQPTDQLHNVKTGIIHYVMQDRVRDDEVQKVRAFREMQRRPKLPAP